MSTENQSLSNDQLDELILNAESEDQRTALIAVRDQRADLERQIESLKQQQNSGSKRLRAKAPTQRAVDAAATFMSDAERVIAWNDAIAEARQADGSVIVTGRIVQLTIGAYFAQRNLDTKGKVEAQAAAPTLAVVPDPAESVVPVAEANDEPDAQEEAPPTEENVTVDEAPAQEPEQPEEPVARVVLSAEDILGDLSELDLSEFSFASHDGEDG